MRINTATSNETISLQSAGLNTRFAPAGAVLLPFAAVVYNAVLAFLNAHGASQTFSSVAVCDFLILASTLGILIAFQLISTSALLVILTSCTISAYVSIVSSVLSYDCARNFTIMAAFYCLGTRMSENHVVLLFKVICISVLVILIVELISTETYVSWFAPSSYYTNTRGIEEFSLDESGLFRNSLSLEGRFSFGLSSHRTASIFIEQVSLANFAAVLSVFVLSFYRRLTLLNCILSIGTVILILITNDTRTSLFFAGLCCLGYFLFPRIPSYLLIVIFPAVLAAGTIVYWVAGGGEMGDDMVGRISITMQHLANFGLEEAFGFSAGLASSLMDSGYAHVVATCTLAGLIALWIGIASAVPHRNRQQKRCGFALTILFAINLMIGGTAIFSLKIAAPLWILVGYISSLQPPVPSSGRLAYRPAPRS